MDQTALLQFPLGQACGAPAHDYYFRTNAAAAKSILEMVRYAHQHGLKNLLQREYPDPTRKNIIVNIIEETVFLVDGNRHAVAFLLFNPNLTLGELETLHPGLLRIWQAGVEEGKNDARSPYEVYIPVNIDISHIPGARADMDYFKAPPAPAHVVPATFRPDSPLLEEKYRGRPLHQTALSVLKNRLL